jgi:uncharacterized protein (TIRG00374 family)
MADQSTNSAGENQKKKKSLIRYIAYILIVLIATGVSLAFSLWDSFDNVVSIFSRADWRFILLVLGLVALIYMIQALILVIFCRLYTRKYKFHQGLAASMVCQFYSDVTPGASGGQIMEVYTMRNQGIQVSNAASIMVMWFILYQSALIAFGVLSLGFEWNAIMSIKPNIGGWQPPMWPLILIGFLLNLSVILILYLMSFSHKIHNFILHYIIGFLGKIRILKNPDKTRENLRVQVENFKIELKRLQSNIPVLIVQFLLFFGMIFLQYSLPYFCGLALHAFENADGVQHFVFASTTQASMVSASFRAALHQMVTGLIPLPGSAGVSEMFYEGLFLPFFGNSGSMTTATQILWRTATFHIVLLVSGLVSAFYRSRARESFAHANHETYVNLQFATFEERKRSADTMYETAQLSRIELQKKLRGSGLFKKKEDVSTIGEPVSNLNLPEEKDEMAETRNKLRETREAKRAEEVKAEEPKKKRREKKKKSKKDKDEGWESWEI